MLELNLVLMGLVIGLLVAMFILGQTRVIVPPIERVEPTRGEGGCWLTVVLIFGLFFFLLLAGNMSMLLW